MEKIRLSTSYSSMQVAAAILLLVTCYLPLVVYLHPSQQSIQTTARNIPPPLLTLLVLDSCCLVPSNSVYNLQKQCIQQAKCTFHPSDVTDHFIGWKSIPGCRTEISSVSSNHQPLIIKFTKKINVFLWLTLPKYHQYCDYQILISLCSFLNQMAPENDEMKFQKL